MGVPGLWDVGIYPPARDCRSDLPSSSVPRRLGRPSRLSLAMPSWRIGTVSAH